MLPQLVQGHIITKAISIWAAMDLAQLAMFFFVGYEGFMRVDITFLF